MSTTPTPLTLTRTCTGCARTLPITAFARDRTQRTRIQRRYRCTQCTNRARDLWKLRMSETRYQQYRATERARQNRLNHERRTERKEALIAMLTTLVRWGYTKKAIAEMSGVSPTTIWRWTVYPDQRETVNHDTLERVHRLYLRVVDERTRKDMVA